MAAPHTHAPAVRTTRKTHRPVVALPEPTAHRHAATTLAWMGRVAEQLFIAPADATGIAGRRRPYYIPQDTLTRTQAAPWGIAHPDDLLGGVVPHAFVASKAISHGLPDAAATAPEGWCAELAQWLDARVLPGHSAFALDDARSAARRLLRDGAVRVKPGSGIGGRGQSVVRDEAEADAALSALDPTGLATLGVVLERNLVDAVTYSVGCLAIGTLRIAYAGTQHETRNCKGEDVYGGSDIDCIRGGLDDLLTHEWRDIPACVIEHAIAYDAAIHRAFPGFFASRVNYDIILGRDEGGAERCGVLEQSWRVGGATPAELLALLAFAEDPAVTRVRASSNEFHADVEPPPNAVVSFRGLDPVIGAMTKYALIESAE